MKRFNLLSSICGVALFFVSGCLDGSEGKRSVLSPRQNFSNKTQVVQWQSSSQNVSEGAGTVRATAVLNAESTVSISVPYSVSGSASPGSDHVAVNGTLTIPAGSTTASVSIAIMNDTLVEANETLVLTMGTPTEAVLGTTITHTIILTDNDVAPTPTPSPTLSPKPSPTPSPTISPKPSPTPSPTVSPKPSPTATTTPSPTPTAGCLAAPAGTYYVDGTIGSDTNSGTNTCTPWKTLAKVNSVSLNAGEKILFRRGTTYYGSLTAKYSGASGSPVTYGAYGTGASPVITGFTTVGGWTNLGGNIWESTGAVTALSAVNMVAVNGVNTARGRFPNAGASNGGYLDFQSHVGKTSITSSSLTGTPNWTGAEIVIRNSSWTVDKSTITSQSGSTLNFVTLSGYEPRDGSGFFIQNDPRTLDIQNEWYFNPSTKRLRIFSAAQPTDVKVASIETLLTVNASYVVVDGITLSGSNSYGINSEGNSYPYFTLQNSSVLFSGVTAIRYQSDNLTIHASTVSDSQSNGIQMTSNNNCRVTNSVVQNTGILTGMGGKGVGTRTAINADMNNNLIIQNNRIVNTGYNGINIFGNNVNVSNNLVDTFCSVLDDGGGIYTWAGDRASTTGMKILNNVVLNAKGAIAGRSGNNQAYGIYLDDYSKNVEVSGNTVAFSGSHGIFLHNSSYLTVTNNTCFGNGGGLYYLDNDGSSSNQKILSNIFFPNPTSNTTVQYRSFGSSSINPGGTFDYNYYVQVKNLPIWVQTTTRTGSNMSLDSWKSYSGQDANSRPAPRSATNPADYRFEYNATNTVKTVPLSVPMIDVKGVRYSGSVTLQPFTSIILFKE